MSMNEFETYDEEAYDEQFSQKKKIPTFQDLQVSKSSHLLSIIKALI